LCHFARKADAAEWQKRILCLQFGIRKH